VLRSRRRSRKIKLTDCEEGGIPVLTAWRTIRSSLTLAHELVPFYAVLRWKTSWRAAAASTVSAVVATVPSPSRYTPQPLMD
jgi:hypothetical protein